MQEKLDRLKQQVVVASQNPKFIHHKWFVKYHLEIVEKVAKELCDIYSDANRDIVLVLVWIHDYGKILGGSSETTLVQGRKLLESLNFEQPFIEKVIEFAEIIDKKLETDLRQSPIEVRILSSADAASHFVGPFFSMWWYENSHKDFTELMADNIQKAKKDWNYKMVLPEVKQFFEKRYLLQLEHSGELPSSFLK